MYTHTIRMPVVQFMHVPTSVYTACACIGNPNMYTLSAYGYPCVCTIYSYSAFFVWPEHLSWRRRGMLSASDAPGLH